MRLAVFALISQRWFQFYAHQFALEKVVPLTIKMKFVEPLEDPDSILDVEVFHQVDNDCMPMMI